MKATGIVFEGQRYYSPDATSPPAATWADESRYGTDGTITTATWTRLSSGLYVLDFNSATPDYVEVTCPQCNFTDEDFSIKQWIKAETITGWHMLWCRGSWTDQGHGVRMTSAGQIDLTTDQSGAQQVSSSTSGAITAGLWYLVVATRSGAVGKIYINGVDDTNTSGSHANPATSAATAKIGVFNDKAQFSFNGIIALTAVTNTALTVGQIQQIFNEERKFFGV